MSVPPLSCPTDGRYVGHVDASAVGFHASRSVENTFSPDQASDVHKLASTNRREGGLDDVSNKGLAVNLHAASLQDGDSALINEKQKQDEVSVHSLVPNKAMPDLTPEIPSASLLVSSVPQVINPMQGPATCVDLSTSCCKDSLEQASDAVNPQVINSMEAPAIGVDLSTSGPKDLLEQPYNAVNPHVMNSMEAPASGVDLSTSSPQDLLDQDSNAAIIEENACENPLNTNATQDPINEIVSNQSKAVADDLHTTCASEVPIVACQIVSHSPEDMEVDKVSIGIEMAMSYADESFTGIESNEPIPSDSKVAPYGVFEISGPSTIDKKKQKKGSMKKPCKSEDLFKLVVEDSVKLFYKKYLGNRLIKTKEIARSTIILDINGYPVNYEDFYQSLKARGWISNEVMTAFVEIFNEQFAKKFTDQKSRMKFCFSPYFVSKLNVTPFKV